MSPGERDAHVYEELLEDSAEDLFENAPCGYFSTDEGGRFVKVNGTFLSWTGYERGELVGGKRIQDVLAPGDRIYYETHYSPLLRMQGSVREIAVELVRADGRRLPVLMNSVLRRAREDLPGVIRTTAFDARERRRYEQELVRARKELEDRARAAEALALVNEGVVLVDADETVRLVSPAAEAVLGVARDRLVGTTLADGVAGWSAVADRIPIGSPGAWPRPSVLPFPRGDRDAWISAAGVATGDGTVYTLRDVTSERELDELRSDVVAVVSHELRTPLSGITGAAQTLLARGDSLPDDVRAQLLRVIVEQSARQERVLDAIVLTGRLERGDVEVDAQSVDAAELVRRAVAGLAHLDAAARVVVEAPEGVLVRADAAAVEQALANVIENALKYSPGDALVRVDVEPDEGWTRITVADEGPGIPADARELVFEKFFRLDPEQRGGVSGVGLGLYVARALLDRMGGRIRVVPRERGTAVRIDLARVR